MNGILYNEVLLDPYPNDTDPAGVGRRIIEFDSP